MLHLQVNFVKVRIPLGTSPCNFGAESRLKRPERSSPVQRLTVKETGHAIWAQDFFKRDERLGH
jgi:hypothetical protein